MVGIPHENLGEVPALFVVPRAGQNIAMCCKSRRGKCYRHETRLL